MRILFLTQVLPYPLDAGPKVRAYYVLRHLAETGHAVTLLTFTRASDTPEAVAHLQTVCREVIGVPMVRSTGRNLASLGRSLPTPTPFLIARDDVPAMRARVRELLAGGGFDAVHADQLWMAPYALEGGPGLPAVRRVLDQHNAVFQIPQRMAQGERNPAKRALLALEARKLRRYEQDVCRHFDEVAWVTAEDRAAVYPAKSAARGRVIPICVDPEGESPIPPVPQPRRVTFVGGMHWPPNAAGMAWFAAEVWPQVQAAVPGARLTVLGKQPPAQVTRLANVDAPGYVADLRPWLAETAAFIVPLHAGGGMRVKILDAWRWGLPIVSTTIGAEGLAVRPGTNLLLADDASRFAEAVSALLRDAALRERLRAGGHATVVQDYDWRRVYRAWDEIYPCDSC